MLSFEDTNPSLQWGFDEYLIFNSFEHKNTIYTEKYFKSS